MPISRPKYFNFTEVCLDQSFFRSSLSCWSSKLVPSNILATKLSEISSAIPVTVDFRGTKSSALKIAIMSCTTQYFLTLDKLIADVVFPPYSHFARSLAPVITRAIVRVEQIIPCTGICVGLMQNNSSGSCPLSNTSFHLRIACL